MTRIIRGYRQGQQGGGVLVTIDDDPLGLPPIDPKTEARHSPTGFQFGYGGSGPAELARAILIALYPGDRIVRHPACYQDFKWDVIAQVRGEELRLTSDEVDAWYQTWRAAHPHVLACLAERDRLDAEIARLDAAERGQP